MANDSYVFRFNELPAVERGGGVKTIPLVGKTRGAVGLTTGITYFPPKTAIPLHYHNCPEQVTVLEGEAEVDIAGERHHLRRLDTTFVAAGKPHCFRNIGTVPMAILWIYGADDVTRTFAETGETVQHLSARDTGAVEQPA